MASSISDEEVGWGAVDSALVTVGGWSTLVHSVTRHHVMCDCCQKLNVGCLCEETTRYYAMHLAEKTYQQARKEYWDWFDVHRRPQIERERL